MKSNESNFRVAILSPSKGLWGGGQIYIQELARYLIGKGVDTSIATAEPDVFDVPCIAIPSIESRKDRLSRGWRIARLLRAAGFERVLLNDLSALWLAPFFRLRGFDVGALLHLYLRAPSHGVPGHSLLERQLLIASARFCDRVFSVNRENEAQFSRPVIFVGNYAPEWFFSHLNEINPSEKEYDLVFVGRLAPQKNVPLFIELLRALNGRSSRPITARIVGDGPSRDEVNDCIQRAQLSEHVTLEAWVEREDLPQVFDSGRVFAMTSVFEGFATTLLESHARGLPAIVTESSGFGAEFVREVEKPTGYVLGQDSLRNPAALDAMLDIIENAFAYRQRCITKARRFTPARVYAPILEWCRPSPAIE